ncbi:MAG: SurA N-terminal domain-containing protein [Pseudomonadota bacterium]
MAKASNPVSKTAIWILMGLLILSLGGFGITQLGGSARSLGEVGDKQIDIDQYARQLSQEINFLASQRGSAVPFAEAQQLGIDRAVLGRLVRARALDHETAQLGLSVGDATLREEILAIQGFRGIDGQFDRDAYAFALEQAGLSEAQFEARLREEAARNLLQAAIVSGTEMPDTYSRILADYAGETRALTLMRLDEGILDAPLPAPAEQDLREFHAGNPDLFQIPATRQITYVLLTPDSLVDSVEVPEDQLRALYDDRAAQYNTPERRLVERLPFLDGAAADAAAAQLEVGGTSFEALVAERGLTLADVDLGDVGRLELDAAGEAVFGAAVGDVVGPLPSPLGPALFRVNGILPAQSTSFEEARAALQAELARDRAERLIAGLAEDFDDQLAGGATLEQLAEETQLELGQIDWHDAVDADIAAYPSFSEAAARATSGDFPQIELLEDGGVFALRLDGESPARNATYEEAGEDVRALFEADRLETALGARAEALVAELEGGADPAALGLSPRAEPSVTRSTFLPGTPQGTIDRVFEMAPGDLEVVTGFGAVTILRLDAVTPASENPEVEQVRADLAASVSQQLGQTLLQIYTDDTLRRAGSRIDQRTLQAVHVNFP